MCPASSAKMPAPAPSSCSTSRHPSWPLAGGMSAGVPCRGTAASATLSAFESPSPLRARHLRSWHLEKALSSCISRNCCTSVSSEHYQAQSSLLIAPQTRHSVFPQPPPLTFASRGTTRVCGKEKSEHHVCLLGRTVWPPPEPLCIHSEESFEL